MAFRPKPSTSRPVRIRAGRLPARTIAAAHPPGGSGPGVTDRGQAIAAMTEAFAAYIPTRTDLDGIIDAGGSGGTVLLAPGFRAMPIGFPKLHVSTVASGNVAP